VNLRQYFLFKLTAFILLFRLFWSRDRHLKSNKEGSASVFWKGKLMLSQTRTLGKGSNSDSTKWWDVNLDLSLFFASTRGSLVAFVTDITSPTYSSNTNSFSFSKSGVPSPVTGSHPTVAFHDAHGMILAPGSESPLCVLTPLHPTLPPNVISFRAAKPMK
jgi:hypothetical protein